MEIKYLSPSSLQLYADCPSCFYLKATRGKQVTSPQMLFGTRVHRAIKRYHKFNELPEDEDLAPYIELYSGEYDSDYQEVEERWEVPLPDSGIILRAIPDLVKDDFLIEHKTTQSSYSQDYVDTMRQLTAYSWMWSQKFSLREKLIRINVFTVGEEPTLDIFETSRDDTHFAEWLDWVREIISGIENDIFPANKDAKWHNYEDCEFYQKRV